MLNPFNYKLSPPDLERDFRRERQPSDRRILLVILPIAAVLMLIFLLLALSGGVGDGSALASAILRVFGIFGAIIGIWKIHKTYDYETDEPIIFASSLVIVAHLIADNSRHDYFMSIVTWDLVSILGIYCVTALNSTQQFTLAGALTLGSLYFWFTRAVPELDFTKSIGTPLAYLAANSFGLIMSANINRSLRKDFKARVHEEALKHDLQKTTETLRETINTRDQLFSLIAHDLRGPIGALGSIAQYLLVQDSKNEAKRNELIELICKAATSSHVLLENLLSWALSETEDLSPKLQPVDLGDVVDSNIKLLSAVAANKEITLANDCSASKPVLADPQMISTVVRNLISNALKFTHRGGNIRISQESTSNQEAILKVTDNGVGIPTEKLPQIFNLDFKTTSRGTDGESGSNLGLRLCSQFMHKQGGQISAQSEVGKGSSFSLKLPYAPNATSE
ncbi:sensor histidine kinase [Pelagicoccus mobilis]|uniref:histidine kinase n=1 Tax=Pelagicoccus mobilis TaxID=415221 RepID=A0A934S0B2_9BACT|nr:HAMP domain-containing sensor histidine kinase [Pelagicoccus mobilis]MBK1876753.1 HAMP domain-containing histidine kinase [Pelagicoccus mobilis]